MTTTINSTLTLKTDVVSTGQTWGYNSVDLLYRVANSNDNFQVAKNQQLTDSNATSVLFDSVQPGYEYKISVKQIDTSGNIIGSVIESSPQVSNSYNRVVSVTFSFNA